MHPASYATYAGLRDHKLDGTWKLGHTASWARWGTTTHDLDPITAGTEGEFLALKPLTTAVILFAINWGGESLPSSPTYWSNFHARGHRGDATLRNSVDMAMERAAIGGPTPAPYLTDVFKLIPTPTAAKLGETIKTERNQGIDHVARCASILREELTLCLEGAGGQRPILVGMGAASRNWLRGSTQDDRIAQAVDDVLGRGARHEVREMPHYTFGTGSNEIRASKLAEVLSEASQR